MPDDAGIHRGFAAVGCAAAAGPAAVNGSTSARKGRNASINGGRPATRATRLWCLASLLVAQYARSVADMA
eukprot:3066306-Rhodomonas_salina.1